MAAMALAHGFFTSALHYILSKHLAAFPVLQQIHFKRVPRPALIYQHPTLFYDALPLKRS